MRNLLRFLPGLPANRPGPAPPDVTHLEPPVRAELFGVERLEEHARGIAAADTLLADPRKGKPLLRRISKIQADLQAAQRTFTEELQNKRPVPPAAEWLLDNFYIVQNQLRQIEQDLSRTYYWELPKLAAGQYAGYPRVYGMAMELIAHTDSHLDGEVLTRFVRAYQTVAHLTIGEIWAVAIMLRVGLAENLRRLINQALVTRQNRLLADHWADHLLGMANAPRTQFVVAVAELAGSSARLNPVSVIQLLERLRDQAPAVTPAIEWLETWLAEHGTNIEAVIRAEHQRRAANRVSVGNVITSMRALSTLDWPEFFETLSVVEQVLRQDPAGVYAQADFATRDRYRHVVELLSKRSRLPETEVARRVVERARNPEREPQSSAAAPLRRAQPIPTTLRRSHVGYYLIDRGRPAFEAEIGYRANPGERLKAWARQHATLVYLGSIGILTALFALPAWLYAASFEPGRIGPALIGLLLVIPASVLAISAVQWVITISLPPRVLPKLEFKDQIPAAFRTMVVVPALISQPDGIRRLFEAMEIRFLGNQDPHLHFALLGDFADSDEEQRPEDAELIRIATQYVADLNARYAEGREDRFYFFHRRRSWNAAERIWMGWERKRGKLIEFNRLLRGAGDTNYTVQVGNLSVLPEIRYVITLDADTELPLNSARRLIGAMAHPLNHPRLDPATQTITEGYGIFQPRTAVTAVAATQSRFTRLLADDVGLDPYARAVSTVYQDLFGEGSYIGKAIYDVDAALATLADRFPENLLLSHDLIEGAHIRTGLVSDIQLLEDFPTGYDAYIQRQHRWTRGDWQITRWLFPSVRDGSGRRVRNPLPAIARWKILDNMRASLVAPNVVVLLLLGWTALPGSPLVWTAASLLPLLGPLLTGLVLSSGVHPPGEPWRAYLRVVAQDAATHGMRALVQLAFLLFEAFISLDAITRVFVRRKITHRGLLEWNTAALVERGQARSLGNYWGRMGITAGIGAVILIAVSVARPSALPVALPIGLLWLAAPFIAYWLSQPIQRRDQPLPESARRELRLLARRIWGFYEAFAGPEDHWLPPDNYQHEPNAVVAHRTSPTNIGFLLLSSLAAYDFGWIGLTELADRLERVVATMEELERHRGHLFNWYDTRTLEPLLPEYVSTVDSGNLAASLIVVRQACAELLDAPLVSPRAIVGLEDTVSAIQVALGRFKPHTARAPASVKRLESILHEMRSELASARPALALSTPAPQPAGRNGSASAPGPPASSAEQWTRLLDQLARLAESLAEQARHFDEELGPAEPHDVLFWCSRLSESIQAYRAEQASLLAWLEAAHQPAPEPWGQTAAEPASALRCLTTWPSLRELAEGEQLSEELAGFRSALPGPESEPGQAQAPVLAPWLDRVEQAMRASGEAARQLRARYQSIGQRAGALVKAMDFNFLYNAERGVFSIGFNRASQRLDNSYYDLLASEARLASLVAIAMGEVPARHWFRLSRPLTWTGGHLAAFSWGGTMFEYLMPTLLMRDFDRTLLQETIRAAIQTQIDYGARRHVPWGISESGFYAFDYQFNYQYQLFGVPDLGLKRDLANDLVVAPYATFLALPYVPHAAWDNLQRLARAGAADGFGFYEAIDYTPARRPKGQPAGVVRSFMAHHQGMSLVALDNYLNQSPMVRRFHAEPAIAAIELLLQERLPRHVPLLQPHPDVQAEPRPRRQPGDTVEVSEPATRRFVTPHTLTPRTHLLSNGSYQVMLTNAGGGHSLLQAAGPGSAVLVTRWRKDITRDNWGMPIYIRDVESGVVWSNSFQPTLREPDDYEVTFAQDRAEYRRRDFGLEAKTEITVSPRDNAEIRRVSITNFSQRARVVELTSYAEIALEQPRADAAHPAFSKLFVESEFVFARSALLFRRRPRAAEQAPFWAMHLITSDSPLPGEVTYETDRARFLGRGGTSQNPAAVHRPLSNSSGATLDPVMSLRARLRLPPGGTVRVSFVTGVAGSREGVLALADKYCDVRAIENAFDLAWVYAQIQLRHLGLSDKEAHLFQRLASRVIYPDPALRAPADVLAANSRGQSALWAYGISGDFPIVLVRVDDAAELDLVRQLLHAHEFWRLNNFAVDLVILNEYPTTYGAGLQDQLQGLIDSSLSRPWLDKPGGVFVRRSEHMPLVDRVLLQTVARVVLDGDLGTLGEQLERSPRQLETPAPQDKRGARPAEPDGRQTPAAAAETGGLLFENGLGGFSPDGREYVIRLQRGRWTPAPWSNVLANPAFGCLVSESGLGYTWSENSQSNRLTPWSNDPVSDPQGEVLYLHDDDSGQVWTPTPLPIRDSSEDNCLIRHGAGYSLYESKQLGIASELLVFVPVDDPVKIMRLRLRNESGAPRHLAVTAYAEWVLGAQRTQMQPFVVTELDSKTGAIFARNAYNADFADRVAFAALAVPNQAPWLIADATAPAGSRRERRALRSITGDRTEFLGRNGTPAAPAALTRGRLSNRVGPALDPCAAIQSRIQLAPGEETEVVFLLGQAREARQARDLVQRYSDPAQVRAAHTAVLAQWESVLGAVQIATPDPALDVLVNRWLLYQTLACRYWARSAFYQSGGAYGFRDQLQDVAALLFTRPDLAREHILRAAARQFAEGDVQHWWHPHSGQGVRTRFSDDYLWLPFITHAYVAATGDTQILDEPVPLLSAPLLHPDQHEVFVQDPHVTPPVAVYEHCARALDYGLSYGPHGLPRIGIGDWNDGMNRVGHEGRGESIWLGWFLYTNLTAFADVAEQRGHVQRAERYRQHAANLQRALEEHGWDGAWYRRAYFDDGTPMGSAQNDECKIDSIAQSWAVLSGAAPPDRARAAMESLDRHLVRLADGLLLLLTPPFNQNQPDPGYIQGYVPGIRENGGQYTHAALWAILAHLKLGNGDQAGALLRLINPVYHGQTPEQTARYKVEPYVVAADVYSHPQHVGRGGWTWYTGSAAWMYRVAVEGMLGFTRQGDQLNFDPCIPSSWDSFRITYRFGAASYHIEVKNPQGVNRGVRSISVDGAIHPGLGIPLEDDGQAHQVIVELGPDAGPPDAGPSESDLRGGAQ